MTPRLRHWAIAGGVVAILVASSALPGVRWRLAVLKMKTKGEAPTFAWGELIWNLRPHSEIYLRDLPASRNPDLAIINPHTTSADSVAGADAFRRYCANCHGVDAHGGESGPSLTPTDSPRDKSDW